MSESKYNSYAKKPNAASRKRKVATTKLSSKRSKVVNATSQMPIAPRYVCNMKYSDTVLLTLTGGALNAYQFRLNSLFDPDLTGTGHQPYGFDTLAGLYNKYRVFGAKWKVTATAANNATANAQGIEVIVLPDNSNTTFSNVSLMSESPRSDSIAVSLTGNPNILRGSVYLPTLTGRPAIAYKSDDIYASVPTTNPSEAMTLNIGAYSGSSNYVSLFIELIYQAEWYDPVPIAQS